MHRVNTLGRPVLITPDEVLFHAAIEGDADLRLILQSIIPAEERIIAPALGDDFYYAFCNAKNQRVTSGNQASMLATINASRAAAGLTAIQLSNIPIGCYVNAIEFVTDTTLVELWEWHLHKLCAEAVDLMVTVPTWLRNTKAGQQKNNPEVIGGNNSGSASGDRKDVQFKLDILMQDRIDPLAERMHLWLCKRKTSYPLYTKVCECDNPNGVGTARKTDWIFVDTKPEKKQGCNDCVNGWISEVGDCFLTEDGNNFFDNE